MFNIGGILFALGVMSFLGAQLQYSDFFILSPSYYLIICGVGLLFLAEWRDNKNPKKKISLFGIACFLLGFLGFIVLEGNNWFFLSIGLFSIICGIVFMLKYTKDSSKWVGKTLSVTGIIMGGIIFLFALPAVIFNIK